MKIAAQKLGIGIGAGRNKIAEQQIDSIINYAKQMVKLDPVHGTTKSC